jgi:GMP synthase (glutamine-hydrolysing)
MTSARSRGRGGAGGPPQLHPPARDAAASSSKSQGVSEPERKRKIIGRTFIEVFESAARRAGKARFLAQGTLYPDVIESVPIAGNPAALIKSHHNVGGLPKRMRFELVEPLRCLFKDEVRVLGLELGLPRKSSIASFPSPAAVLPGRDHDGEAGHPPACGRHCRGDEGHGRYYKVWQSFAVLLPVRSVGDGRRTDLRPHGPRGGVADRMTADCLAFRTSLEAGERIVNEARGVNRCVFDITSKPQARSRE